jgi:hypothetical protein
VHAENVSAPDRLDVTNGDDATARYQLVVNNQSALPSSAYATPESGDYPTFTPAIYSAAVDATFQRSALTYETPVLLAPESAPADDSDAVAA